MSLATLLKVGKKDYVIITRRRFEQLKRLEQDQKDAKLAETRREAVVIQKSNRRRNVLKLQHD